MQSSGAPPRVEHIQQGLRLARAVSDCPRVRADVDVLNGFDHLPQMQGLRPFKTSRRRARLAMTVVSALAMAILTSAQAPPQGQQGRTGQQGQPTFRSSTRLVVQTVTVKDRDGNPVEGL